MHVESVAVEYRGVVEGCLVRFVSMSRVRCSLLGHHCSVSKRSELGFERERNGNKMLEYTIRVDEDIWCPGV